MDATPNREAEFLARVTAGTTHEFRNVLATVKESAGLVSDLIAAAQPPASPDPAKLLRAVARVDAQVARGAALLTALNGLSHALDEPVGTVDLARVVEQVVVLSGRLARQQRRGLEAASVPDPVTVTVHSLRLQMALVAALECCLELAPEGDTVVLRPARSGGRASVQFSGAGGDPWAPPAGRDSPHGALLRESIRTLGASVESIDGDAGFAILLPEREVA